MRLRKGLATASGHMEAKCQNITFTVEFKMINLPANDTNVTGRQLWGVEAGYVIVDIDLNAVEFTFEGNVWADFINMFQALYMPLAVEAVEIAMTEQLTNLLPEQLNFYFYEIDGYLEAFDDKMPKFEQFIMDMSADAPI